MDEPTENLRRFLFQGSLSAGQAVTLGPEQSRHLARVLRARAGESIVVFTGAGREFLATVERADQRAARVRIERQLAEGPALEPDLVLAFAPPPGSRPDVLVEKATEAGATVLQPLVTARLQARRARAARARTDRWERKARDAARQSGRLVVPRMREPVEWAEFLSACDDGSRLIGADARARPLWHELQDWDQPPQRVTLAVGPAGGFTTAELDRASRAGFRPVALGPHVLRVETAAIAMLSAVVMRLHALSSESTREPEQTETQ
jgi:16S rRNA (uracil1498-N3)-methyltransferase